MRVCLLGDSDSIHVRRWATYLIERGHEVHIISGSKREVSGAVMHKLKTVSKLNFILAPPQIILLLKKINPDVIHAHYLTKYGLYAALSGFHPLVISAWGSDISSTPEISCILKALTELIIKKADLVHVGDKLSKNRLIELGCGAEKVIIQRWGVDTDVFSPGIPMEAFKKHEIGKDLTVINCRNAKNPDYNLGVFIKAVPLVLKKMKNVRFIIVGSDNAEKDLEKLAKEMGVERYVILLGGVKHELMPEYISNSDVYVDTYYTSSGKAGAGLGSATAEAMSCGTPQILASRPEIDELGGDFYGLTFNPKDPSDLAEKILKLLEDGDLRERIGKKSREFAIKSLDWKKNMQEWEKVYGGVLFNVLSDN
jgi:L-malate glycosyltransferase